MNVDGTYISKYTTTPEDKNRFWLAVGAVGAGALLFESSGGKTRTRAFAGALSPLFLPILESV